MSIKTIALLAVIASAVIGAATVLATPAVPEPGGAAMLLAGFGLIGAIARRGLSD